MAAPVASVCYVNVRRSATAADASVFDTKGIVHVRPVMPPAPSRLPYLRGVVERGESLNVASDRSAAWRPRLAQKNAGKTVDVSPRRPPHMAFSGSSRMRVAPR